MLPVYAAVKEFQLQGINHLALVCKDMAETVDFYCNTLGLTLTKTIQLPDGGQHFFFDVGNGDAIAFFWFPNAPEAAPGVASVDPVGLQQGQFTTAHGSMNHVAFRVAASDIEDYYERFTDMGIQTTPILHHSDVPGGFVPVADEKTFLSSFYFFDPNGILLEFAAALRELGEEGDVQYAHLPVLASPQTTRAR